MKKTIGKKPEEEKKESKVDASKDQATEAKEPKEEQKVNSETKEE